MTIVDRDRGYRKLRATIMQSRSMHVTVGVHDDAGDYGGGESVAEIAAKHEFGDDETPQRSFLRAYVDEDENKIRQDLKKFAQLIIKGMSVKQALEQFGAKQAASIQRRIAAGISPPNAPSTVARKGSSKPLVDTGVLKSAITHKVENGG